ncbi:hypothetical protein OH723_24370 [Streptomyces albidoflavus]|uniref:hypothetical protein n=1 Tax=Streptomyces albidoflavus TaxID=1886 RepID=UPI00386EB82B|nr:hypothetical protein OH723_24370 [Streptomyces albidoflavus]
MAHELKVRQVNGIRLEPGDGFAMVALDTITESGLPITIKIAHAAASGLLADAEGIFDAMSDTDRKASFQASIRRSVTA